MHMAFDLDSALAEALRLDASDLHLKQDAVPRVRLSGELIPLEGWEPLEKDDVRRVQEQVIRSELKKLQFAERGSADVSYYAAESRFRVTAFRTQGHSPSSSAPSRTRRSPVASAFPTWRSPGPTPSAAWWSSAVPRARARAPPARHCSASSTSGAAATSSRSRTRSSSFTGPAALINQREIGKDTPNNVEAIRAASARTPT